MIKKIGIAGSGIMGAGIAQVFTQSGYEVLLYDLNKEALKQAKDRIRLNQKTLIEEGVLTVEAAEEALKKIETTSVFNRLGEMDCVIEAIVEKLDVKRNFFTELEQVCDKTTVFASNTSSLSMNDIAIALKHRERFVGTNWWNPSHIIPLVEVTKCIDTSDETTAEICNLLESAGKKPVVLNKEIEGFIGNRIQFAVFREALNIANQGIASYEAIDDAIKYGIGFRYASLGPFETADLGGLDTFYYISKGLFKELSDEKVPPNCLEDIYNQGHYGIKNGKGFFDYQSEAIINERLDSRDKRFIRTLDALNK